MDEKEIYGLDFTMSNKKSDAMYPLYFGVSCAFFALQVLSKPYMEFQRCSKIRENMLQGSAQLLGLLVWKVQKEDPNGAACKLRSAEKEIENLKRMRSEDGKANEKVVGIFAAQEQSWLIERKKLCQHIGALMNELRVSEKKKDEAISELNEKLKEMEVLVESRDTVLKEEEQIRKELEEKLTIVEREAEELRENGKQKTAFIGIVLEQKEESEMMTHNLSMEVGKVNKDLEQKSKVLSAMLRKSKLDASEKQILLKEVKLSKARRKQAEQEAEKWRAVSEGKCKRQSLRSMLINLGSTRLSHISKEPEHFSPICDHYLPKSYEEFAITANGKRLEDWVKAEAEKYATMIEQRHHIELDAFAEEMSSKDEKLEAFRLQLLRMELESKKLQSHVEGLIKEVTQLRYDKMKLQTLLIEREELTSLKEKFTLQLKSSNCFKHNNLLLPPQYPENECEEENEVHVPKEKNPLIPMQKQSLNQVNGDDGERTSSSSESSNKTNHSLWKMDLHALGVSYKIKRLKQQLVLVERLTGQQANGETTEINDESNNAAAIKTYLSLTSLLYKQVGRYQALQEKTDDLCKRMHENALGRNGGDLSGGAKRKEKTETLEQFLEETFQLQRYIVATGQKWVEIQSKIDCGFRGVGKEMEKNAGIEIKRFGDSIRNLLQEIQRGLEIRTARIIGDLEGTLTCEGMIHLRR